MRSKIAQKILDTTPKDVEIFVRLYGDLVVRIHEVLKAKGISQKSLAEGMNKKPSEISKWLNGEHNFTLRSIAKLEAELGEKLIQVPKQKTFDIVSSGQFTMTVHSSYKRPALTEFKKVSVQTNTLPTKIA